MILFDANTGAAIRKIDSNVDMPLATEIQLPSSVLDSEKQYYSFRDKNDQVPYWPTNESRWVVKDKPVKVTAYNKQTREPKEFDDKTLVTDDYTLEKPTTQFDEWIDSAWVTNKQQQYEAELLQVESTRRALYTNVDALRNEASMIRTVEKDEAKAADYEQQAIALYLKIRDENPWPVSPT
ncbi:hypothetical protein [Vibrio algicola]|uniref:Tail fiber assembly protein n=1 Tax=Vibrio algicola TaxID=2662262 RepID=A0A5Q0TKI8_9VIBR|nr:hypothetical protein [Vibrio algicola]